VGIKDSSGDLAFMMRMIAQIRPPRSYAAFQPPEYEETYPDPPCSWRRLVRIGACRMDDGIPRGNAVESREEALPEQRPLSKAEVDLPAVPDSLSRAEAVAARPSTSTPCRRLVFTSGT
jgi:hypothetical protein